MSTREYPQIWPENGLFAFSGVDGPTPSDQPFVGRGLDLHVGWRFALTPEWVVMPSIANACCRPRTHEKDYYFADCWRGAVTAGDHQGLILGCFVDAHAINLRLVFRSAPPGDPLELRSNLDPFEVAGALVCAGMRWWGAIASDAPSPDRRFGVAVSFDSEEEAVRRAKWALNVKVKEVVRRKLDFYEEAPLPVSLQGEPRRVYRKAVSVQKAHVVRASQTAMAPSRNPNESGCGWYALLCLAALRHTDRRLAKEMLRNMLARQQDDGRFIGPGENPTGLPLYARMIWKIAAEAEDAALAKAAYEPLTRYLAWYETNRRTPTGLFAWRRDADRAITEAGMPGSARLTAPDAAAFVDMSTYIAGEYRFMEKLARLAGRPYETPKWKDKYQSLAGAMNDCMWDDQDLCYYDTDVNGEPIPVKTIASLLPLYAGVPDRDQAEALRMDLRNPATFNTHVPVPTVPIDDPAFTLDSWQGPSHMAANVIVGEGLRAYGFIEEAHALAMSVRQAVQRWYNEHGVIYEFYDPRGDQDPAGWPNGRASPAPDCPAAAAAYIEFCNGFE